MNWRAIRWGALALLAVVLVVAAVAVVRAVTLESSQIEVDPVAGVEVDTEAAVERFAASLRIATVSRSADNIEIDAFEELIEYLATTFPRCHQALGVERVGPASLLYSWPGSDVSLAPLLVLGHLDVVPVLEGTESDWQYPPFDGVVAEGFIWGRGAMDDKVNVVGLLEACEILLAEDFEPRRTILMAFGHDEEVGGRRGAVAVAATLEERGVRPAMILDEGMALIREMVPGIDGTAAMIGVAEKGYLSLELTAAGSGGHSSTPPRETSVGILAKAIARLQENPMAGELVPPARDFIDALAPEVPFGQRLAMGNLWLFEGMVVNSLSQAPGTDAMLRTTTAPTMLSASSKDNILPPEARAVVNFRVHPQDSVDDVIEHVRRTIDDDRVSITPYNEFSSEPSPMSPAEGPIFDWLATTVREIFPQAIVLPTLVLGATDARHYAHLSEHVYRFTPMVVGPKDLERIHGTNERLPVDDYPNVVRFYARLFETAGRLET